MNINLISRFFAGICSFGAILPSFYTSYPYASSDKMLSVDCYNVGDDIKAAIYKYENMGKS